MMAVLIAVRDALIVLALSWVGVTLERASEAPQPKAEPAASSALDAPTTRPSFNNLACPDDV